MAGEIESRRALNEEKLKKLDAEEKKRDRHEILLQKMESEEAAKKRQGDIEIEKIEANLESMRIDWEKEKTKLIWI